MSDDLNKNTEEDIPVDNYETDYEVGQDNVDWMGFDIHNPVFFLAAGLMIAFCGAVLAMPEQAAIALQGARNWTLHTFDWFYVIVTNTVFVFCAYLGLSSLGKIRLGGDDAKPEFSTLSWLCMLFAAGVGIGMIFFGAAEPLGYYTDWAGSPLNVEARTEEAERFAFSATIFHWGIIPWAIYAVMGLALAFFAFNKNLPLTIRSTFYPIFGEKTWGWPGHLIDLLAVLATLFGLATSLGLGAQQAASGVSFLFGISNGLVTQVVLICAITLLALISVLRGLDGGVKILSNINIILAILVLLFVIVFGPTAEIFKNLGINTYHYAKSIPALTNWIGREDSAFFNDWTIFYWAWWISWSPFVGMFIARVSYGRTVREFIAAVICIPFVVMVIWFTAIGTTAIEQVKDGIGALPAGISDFSLVWFQMFENLPFAQIMSFLSIILLMVFFVTSSDSGSLVIDSITAGGKLHAPIPQRIFWATLQGLVAIVLLVGGGSQALSSIQAGAVATGLPFGVVLLICCFSLYKGMKTNTEVAPKDNTSS